MGSAELQPSATAGRRIDHSFWRGVLVGLVPLATLALTLALAVALTTLAHVLWSSSGFLVWQWIVTVVWIGGLVIAALVFAYAAFRLVRRVAVWRRAGLMSQVAGAYWAIGFTVLAILLPVVIAAILPQHPAPPRAP